MTDYDELIKALRICSSDMTEEQAYEKLCAGCEYEKRCHEDCTVCDAFLVAIGEDDE